MNILFICNQNKNRSKRAELLLKSSHNTKSAGLYNEDSLNKEQMSWADLVVVMEDEQRKEIGKRFPAEYLKKEIISLGIPDIYSFEQKELDEILKKR